MKCQGVQCDQLVIHRYNFHDFILLYIYLIQFIVCLLGVRYSLLVQKTLVRKSIHLTGKGQFHSATEMTRKIKTLDYW